MGSVLVLWILKHLKLTLQSLERVTKQRGVDQILLIMILHGYEKKKKVQQCKVPQMFDVGGAFLQNLGKHTINNLLFKDSLT